MDQQLPLATSRRVSRQDNKKWSPAFRNAMGGATCFPHSRAVFSRSENRARIGGKPGARSREAASTHDRGHKNNKGNPVKQYEPYFSATQEFEDDDDLVEWGVTPIIHYDALGRATRVDFPDGTYTRTVFGVWKQEAWDQNDTLDDTANAWRVLRLSLASDHPDRIAYNQAVLHAATPSRSYVDALGRPFLAIAHNKQGSSDEFIATRTVLDIEGMPLVVTDPLLRPCQTYAWSIAGQLLAESNIDKGDRWNIATVLGEMLRRWDQRSQMLAAQYDALRRPTHLFLTVASTQTTLERRYYGDDPSVSAPEVDNLRGRPIAIYDGAGLQKLGPYDFKGNLLGSARKLTLLANASATPNWSALDGVTNAATAESTTVVALLEGTAYGETRQYDALNRITSVVTHDTSEFTPTYNEAGLLEAVDVKIRGASPATNFVKNIDYDAKGQRTLIEYSDISGARFATAYTYDPQTFRLTQLVTTRVSPSNTLQDLSYTFDAVGNIVRIKDVANQGPLFTNTVVLPENVYVYDAVYRLVSATGREHKSLGDVQVDENDRPLQNLPHANDSTAVRAYEESYQYDVIGNILQMFHDSGANTWTRTYDYGGGSTNRLAATSVPAPVNSVSYTHDVHGNMTAMPHMAAITYTPFDQMQTAEIATVDAYYVYDSSGQRVRKVVDTSSNLIKERIYLGGYEIYREWVSAAVELERQTLHVMDGVQRIAMVETKTREGGTVIGTPTPRLRFQLGNHLGSATLEVTETGAVISYEEYTPYGVAAYRSSNGSVDVSARRYRYTGKERDEETGLYQNGARYLAAWLGRWTSADPIGMQAGLNLYQYCRGSPINYVDPSGTQEHPPPAPPGYSKDRDVTVEHTPNEQGEIVVESQHFVDLHKALGDPALNMVPPASTEVLDDPDRIRRLQGIGVIEGGDVLQGLKGMWNGTGGWLTRKKFDVDPEHEGAEWVGQHFGQALALEGAGGLVAKGIGRGASWLKNLGGLTDDVAQGVKEGFEADKALSAWSSGGSGVVDATKKVETAIEVGSGGVAKVTEVTSGAAAKADLNKLNHIFGKPEHALDEFAKALGGREQAFQAIQNAANRAFREGKLVPGPNGVLPGGDAGILVDVAGTQVRLIGGRVVNGVVQIASASRKGLP